MQITAPAPIIYLPENLWSFFTKPGKELLIKVINIKGKTLYLELGGEKFQARIGGTLIPEDFTVGEILRVKVTKTGNPIILQILSSTKEKPEFNFLYLISNKFVEKPLNKEVFQKDLGLLTTFIKEIIGSYQKEKREINDKELKELLGEKIKVFELLYKNDKIIIPFAFHEERSWGFLELSEPKEEQNKIKIFYLKIFLEYLGLLECFLGYSDKEIYVDFYISNKEAFEVIKTEIKNLERLFYFHKIPSKINVNLQEISPGQIIEKAG